MSILLTPSFSNLVNKVHVSNPWIERSLFRSGYGGCGRDQETEVGTEERGW